MTCLSDDESHINKNNKKIKIILKGLFQNLNKEFIKNENITLNDFKTSVELIIKPNNNNELIIAKNNSNRNNKKLIILIIIISIFLGITINNNNLLIKYIYETQCFIPNNYFIWEFTRPISNCNFCQGINQPLILYNNNISQILFKQYAYLSRPIIIKNASSNWKASTVFNFNYFRYLYNEIDGSYDYDECQFLPFESYFTSLYQVFQMDTKYFNNQYPWYVGWKNCHPKILQNLKQYYNTPDFFPDDAEIPHTNYVFIGYDRGAIMHLDYIPRLMWQGQILGKKTWSIAPTPECDHVCKPFNFSVETGDILLIDTRIWYHETAVDDGLFSLTITSEYG